MDKILVFNGYYYPAIKYGGPLISIERLVEECGDNFDFRIVARNHDYNDKNSFNLNDGEWKKVGKAKVRYYDDEQLTNAKDYLNIIEEQNPNLIIWSGVYSKNNKIIFDYCRKNNKKVMLYTHGELNQKAVELKKYKKLVYFLIVRFLRVFKNIYFFSTSEEETRSIVKYLKIKKDLIYYIPNIPPNKIHNNISKNDFLSIAFLSRICKIKNLKFALDVVKKLKCTTVFDIYGPIEDTSYWNECLEVIKGMPKNVTVNYKGLIGHELVSIELAKHNCFLFPTFSENYSYSIVEALLSGCYSVISKGTTPWDAIDGKCGKVIDLSKEEEFVECLEKYFSLSDEEKNKLKLEIPNNCFEFLELEKVRQKYIEMFEEMIHGR